MSPGVTQPTDDEIRAVFRNSMFYEIVFTFGIPDHQPWDYCQWESINFTRLAHARLLYDFFEGERTTKSKDDVFAADFGFARRPNLLSKAERERLNKDLMHFTYARTLHTPETKPWPDSILGNLLAPVLDFMRFVQRERMQLLAFPEETENWARLLEILASGRELRFATHDCCTSPACSSIP